MDVNKDNASAVILAAGKGTRMKSQTPKVLHQLCDHPMLWHVLKPASMVTDEQVVVVGYGKEMVESYLQENFQYNNDINLRTVYQEEQLGTGHAVLCAAPKIKHETTLILLGDTPLLAAEDLEGLFAFYRDQQAVGAVLTVKMEDPSGYGRIVRDAEGMVKHIVEDSDATPQESSITEVNTGVMVFDTESLYNILAHLNQGNAQGEYFLTDVISMLYQQGHRVAGYQIEDPERTMGINDRVALARAEKILRRKINETHMQQGVTIVDPECTYIDPQVKIGPDTVIYPGTRIMANSIIEGDCTIGPDAYIEKSTIGKYSHIEQSKVNESRIHEQVKIGPYAHIRPGTEILSHVKVGNFVEVKNSTIREGAKVNHLAYIGDADVGKKVNVGAGAIIVNYDGKEKHRTIIEDHAFVGCNTNLVAPVTIKENAFVAAGSTVTHEVPSNSLAIARARQTNKEDWVLKRFPPTHTRDA